MADERRCFCGNPIPKGRSKFCSDECRYVLGNGNLLKAEDANRAHDLNLQRKAFGHTLAQLSEDPELLPQYKDSERRKRMVEAFKRWGLAS